MAQNGVNSPYSRYGLGMLSDRSMGFNKGMSGVAQGFRNGQEINPANPASYSAVDSLTALFDLGVTLQNGNYKMDKLQQNVRNSSFDHFAFQFRAAKNLGVAISVMPISNIKYSFASNDESLEGTENVTSAYSFTGDGGMREVMLGMGWRPFKPVSIGVNGSYVWGDYSHNMQMSFSQSSAYNMARIYSADISTYNVQAGAQIELPLNKKDKVVLGATYTLGHDVSSNAYRSTQSLSNNTVQAETVDTIKNAFQMPSAIAVGATYYHSDNLRIGADFELQNWNSCRFPNQQTGLSTTDDGAYYSTTGQLNDRVRLSAGLDWTPVSNRIATRATNYFKRCTYKLGGFYSKSYANADFTGKVSDKPYEFGVSAGITFPIANSNTWYNVPKINMSVQWVHTNIPYMSSATQRVSQLNENYIKFNIGLTFSERWFFKWKAQ